MKKTSVYVMGTNAWVIPARDGKSAAEVWSNASGVYRFTTATSVTLPQKARRLSNSDARLWMTVCPLPMQECNCDDNVMRESRLAAAAVNALRSLGDLLNTRALNEDQLTVLLICSREWRNACDTIFGDQSGKDTAGAKSQGH